MVLELLKSVPARQRVVLKIPTVGNRFVCDPVLLCFSLLITALPPVLVGQQVFLEQVMRLAPSCGTIC